MYSLSMQFLCCACQYRLIASVNLTCVCISSDSNAYSPNMVRFLALTLPLFVFAINWKYELQVHTKWQILGMFLASTVLLFARWLVASPPYNIFMNNVPPPEVNTYNKFPHLWSIQTTNAGCPVLSNYSSQHRMVITMYMIFHFTF